jgi:hypothetical protein
VTTVNTSDKKMRVYDRGNGRNYTLQHKTKTVILTRQFVYQRTGNKAGMMIEVCANVRSRQCRTMRIRETEEETGYPSQQFTRLWKYMSPGAVTEILYLFVGEYDESMNRRRRSSMKRKISM